MLIDTHCHLDFKDFDNDRDEVLDRAKKAGVGKIVNVASSVEGSRRSIELAEKYEMIYTSIGVHPHEAQFVTDKVMSDFRAIAKRSKVVAVGEVGLDYYRNLSPKVEQARVFKKFIHLARDLNLPLIVHSRDAECEALDILAEENRGGVNAVMHCFSGDTDFLKRCLDMIAIQEGKKGIS
jgi:TatD DNase family protein